MLCSRFVNMWSETMDYLLLLRMLEAMRDNADEWYNPPRGVKLSHCDCAERDKNAWRLIAYYLAGVEPINDVVKMILDGTKAAWDEELAES